MQAQAKLHGVHATSRLSIADLRSELLPLMARRRHDVALAACVSTSAAQHAAKWHELVAQGEAAARGAVAGGASEPLAEAGGESSWARTRAFYASAAAVRARLAAAAAAEGRARLLSHRDALRMAGASEVGVGIGARMGQNPRKALLLAGDAASSSPPSAWREQGRSDSTSAAAAAAAGPDGNGSARALRAPSQAFLSPEDGGDVFEFHLSPPSADDQEAAGTSAAAALVPASTVAASATASSTSASRHRLPPAGQSAPTPLLTSPPLVASLQPFPAPPSMGPVAHAAISPVASHPISQLTAAAARGEASPCIRKCDDGVLPCASDAARVAGPAPSLVSLGSASSFVSPLALVGDPAAAAAAVAPSGCAGVDSPPAPAPSSSALCTPESESLVAVHLSTPPVQPPPASEPGPLAPGQEASAAPGAVHPATHHHLPRTPLHAEATAGASNPSAAAAALLVRQVATSAVLPQLSGGGRALRPGQLDAALRMATSSGAQSSRKRRHEQLLLQPPAQPVPGIATVSTATAAAASMPYAGVTAAGTGLLRAGGGGGGSGSSRNSMPPPPRTTIKQQQRQPGSATAASVGAEAAPQPLAGEGVPAGPVVAQRAPPALLLLRTSNSALAARAAAAAKAQTLAAQAAGAMWAQQDARRLQQRLRAVAAAGAMPGAASGGALLYGLSSSSTAYVSALAPHAHAAAAARAPLAAGLAPAGRTGASIGGYTRGRSGSLMLELPGQEAAAAAAAAAAPASSAPHAAALSSAGGAVLSTVSTPLPQPGGLAAARALDFSAVSLRRQPPPSASAATPAAVTVEHVLPLMAAVGHDGGGDRDDRHMGGAEAAGGVAAFSLSGVKRPRDAADFDAQGHGRGFTASPSPAPPSSLFQLVAPSSVARAREAVARASAARAAGRNGAVARLVASSGPSASSSGGASFHTPVAPLHPSPHGADSHVLPPPPYASLPPSARAAGGGASSSSSAFAYPHGRSSALATASLLDAEAALAAAVAGRSKAGAHPSFAELLQLRYSHLRPALMAAREAIAPSDAQGQALYSRLLASYRQAKSQLQRLGVALGGHDGAAATTGHAAVPVA